MNDEREKEIYDIVWYIVFDIKKPEKRLASTIAAQVSKRLASHEQARVGELLREIKVLSDAVIGLLGREHYDARQALEIAQSYMEG